MIEIKNLTKRYGTFTALDALTLTIERGTVFGFVGPNGAGKTTTFSILATLIPPTAGDALIDGFSVVRDAKQVRQRIGYMPDFFGVYDQFKTKEYLDFYGASYGIPARERERLIPQLLELVRLSDKIDTYVDLLSRGMKQRLCLARSLIHDPEVLILDEPASGLDPRARIEMREIIKELKNMGKTILISSHILPELSVMCDELCIIDRGKLITHDSVQAILNQLKPERVLTVRVKDRFAETIRFFEDDPHVSLVARNPENNSLTFQFRGDVDAQVALLKKAILADLPIISFQEEKTKMEDVFMELLQEVDDGAESLQ